MLFISRRAGESIRIGDDVTVEVTRIKNGRVCLTIDAPRSCPVYREELYQELNGTRIDDPATELGGIGAEEPTDLGRIEHDATSPKEGLSIGGEQL